MSKERVLIGHRVGGGDKEKAEAALGYVREFQMHKHRGAELHGDHLIVFGNDGIAKDWRSQTEREHMLKYLSRLDDVDVGQFQSAEDEVTWVVVVPLYGVQPSARLLLVEEADREIRSRWDELCKG